MFNFLYNLAQFSHYKNKGKCELWQIKKEQVKEIRN